MSIAFNIQSNKISVLPAVNRNFEVSGDIYSRHTSEEFLSGIINKLIDRNGFVITEKEEFKKDLPFRFNINGYYFKINQLSDIINNAEVNPGDYLYAYIELAQNGSWTELKYGDDTPLTGDEDDIAPSDTTYVYKSVTITDTLPSDLSSTKIALPILRKYSSVQDQEYNWNETGWCVPEDSYVKFDGPSFIVTTIDGGDLDNLL